MSYAFVMTLLILYGIKICAVILSLCTSRPRGWWDITGFQNPRFRLEDRHLQATLQQQWSWQLDAATRPPAAVVMPSPARRQPSGEDRVAVLDGIEKGVSNEPPRLSMPDLGGTSTSSKLTRVGQPSHAA